jgi:hypothetical protein
VQNKPTALSPSPAESVGFYQLKVAINFQALSIFVFSLLVSKLGLIFAAKKLQDILSFRCWKWSLSLLSQPRRTILCIQGIQAKFFITKVLKDSPPLYA